MSRKIRAAQLLGTKVHDVDGQLVGRIEELGVTWTNAGALVTEVHLGPGAVIERLATFFKAAPESIRVRWDQLDLSDPEHPRLLVPKAHIADAAPYVHCEPST